MSTSDEYRKFAQEAKDRAENSWRPHDKEMWLKIAEQWLQLAQDVDGPEKGPRP